MAIIDQTVPKTFSTFDVKSDIAGALLPIVVFDVDEENSEISVELFTFLYHMLRKGYSLPKLRSIANTVGLLHDFYIMHENGRLTTEDNLPSLVLKFFVSRVSGTIDQDGGDPSGLFWTPKKYETYKVDRRNLRIYSDFCVKMFGFFPLTPTQSIETTPLGERNYAALRAQFRRSKHEFLAHLHRFRKERPAYGPNIGGRPSPGRRGGADNRAFIPDDEMREIILGTESIVQRMVFVAGAFAGPRISEQLNMWREDVLPGRYRPLLFPDDHPSDIPLVILAHPYDGQYLGRISMDGTSRAQHLKSKYGRVPRPEMDKGSRAGWKGMLMDNAQCQISQLFWVSEFWAKYYYKLSLELKEQILPLIPSSIIRSHPYLLVNDCPRTKYFGMPLKLSNIRKAWARACHRIGKEPYRGPYHLHGLRDTFVHTLRRCPGLDAADRQRYLHHLSIDSQINYGNDPAILNARLRAFDAQQIQFGEVK